MRSLAPILTLAALALSTLGCGDDPVATTDTDAVDAETDAPDLTGKSVYHLEFDIDGQAIVVDRDLTGLDQYFAFGSTHIAPAVSFGVTDSLQFPRTMSIGINFGIVIASTDHPIQTGEAKTYPFSTLPPSVDVFVKGLQYRSTLPGATGSVVLTDWSSESDGVMAGTFAGTLMSEGDTGKTLTVTGSFHFTLPARTDGQPR